MEPQDKGFGIVGNPAASILEARMALSKLMDNPPPRVIFLKRRTGGLAIGVHHEDVEKMKAFDPWLLHLCLRDEAGIHPPDAMQFPGSFYDYKTQRRSGRVLVHEPRQELLPQMLSKGLVTGESKPVRHNPRPSRFGFLEGLQKHKRR